MKADLAATKKGDAVHLDLGYRNGLKLDAVVSPKGVDVSEKRVPHPAFDRTTCKWLHDEALGDCVYSLDERCDFIKMPMRTTMRLNKLDDHPRWKVVADRFEGLCEAACKAKKKPAYTRFAKDVCGP
jgi:hypothetical protein